MKRLTTTVEEDRSREELLNDYRAREVEFSKAKRQLEAELNLNRREFDRAQSERQDILTTLRVDLDNGEVTKTTEMKTLQAHYAKRRKEAQEKFNQQKEELEKKIAVLKEREKQLRTGSQEEEAGKKRKVRGDEKMIDREIKRFDEDIRSHTINLQNLKEASKKEDRQLTELREHFKKVEMENDCIRTEEGLVEARRAKMEKERARRNQMSALVQGFWRGIIMREQFAQMRKNKKKKKASGKKKGKAR